MEQGETSVPKGVPANPALPIYNLPTNVSLFEAKARKGLTFDQIARVIDKDEVWLAAAFYGQAKFSEEDLRRVCELLEVDSVAALSQIGSHWWPNRGIGPMPPQDPVIYRLYEGVLVYGHAIKAIIHEKFGDGIMSLIDKGKAVKRQCPQPQ